MNDHDDPFSDAADPYPPPPRIPLQAADPAPHACACSGKGPSLTRRQALLGVGALVALPAAAAASAFPVPCVQEKQQVSPCRHKFCRHYGGGDDYHGR